MNEISAMASSAISMMQGRMQEQISMNILKDNAEAAQSIVDVLMQNAQQVKILSENTSSDNINIFA
ncbi:MAG: hypothetical protein ABFD75_04460 [Smithella sp.]